MGNDWDFEEEFTESWEFIFLLDIYCNQPVCVTPRSFSSLSLGKIRDMYVHRRRLKFSSAKHSSCKSWAHT